MKPDVAPAISPRGTLRLVPEWGRKRAGTCPSGGWWPWDPLGRGWALRLLRWRSHRLRDRVGVGVGGSKVVKEGEGGGPGVQSGEEDL